MTIETRSSTTGSTEFSELLRRATEDDDTVAQIRVGNIYHLGKGMAQDYAVALRFYRMAADKGHAGAENNIGDIYGKTGHHAEAVKWFRKAADKGQVDGQFNLGVAYVFGQGVTQDDTEGANWFRKAADQGHTDAQRNLGFMYASAQGVPLDYAEAAKLLRNAADKGSTDARAILWGLYVEGKTVPEHPQELVEIIRTVLSHGEITDSGNPEKEEQWRLLAEAACSTLVKTMPDHQLNAAADILDIPRRSSILTISKVS